MRLLDYLFNLSKFNFILVFFLHGSKPSHLTGREDLLAKFLFVLQSDLNTQRANHLVLPSVDWDLVM